MDGIGLGYEGHEVYMMRRMRELEEEEYAKMVANGEMLVVDDHLSFYGKINIVPCIEADIKNIFRLLYGKSKEKYKLWMNQKVRNNGKEI